MYVALYFCCSHHPYVSVRTMARWFRSEDMAYVSIIVNEDAAHTCISDLGKLGMIQFTDLNPELTAFQRRYVAYIKRIDELERKLSFFGEEVRGSEEASLCYCRVRCREAYRGSNYMNSKYASIKHGAAGTSLRVFGVSVLPKGVKVCRMTIHAARTAVQQYYSVLVKHYTAVLLMEKTHTADRLWKFHDRCR